MVRDMLVDKVTSWKTFCNQEGEGSDKGDMEASKSQLREDLQEYEERLKRCRSQRGARSHQVLP